MRKIFLITLALCAGSTQFAQAIDHKNLDEGRPLRLEDAYPIASGEWALETGVGYSMERRSPDHAFLPVEILYGVFPNFQAGIATTLLTNPRSVDGPEKSGDVHLSGLYNFNQETIRMPAFGLKASVNLPSGVRSRGVDVEIKGLVTKSFDRLSLHFNPAYQFIGGRNAGERRGIYKFTLGASYPIGAPMYTRTTLIGDLFTEQSIRHGESNVYGVEVGFRHQLTQRIVLDFGVGSELAGPAQRAQLFATTGISVGF